MNEQVIVIQAVKNGFIVRLPSKPFNPYVGIAQEMKQVIPGHDKMLEPQQEEEDIFHRENNVTVYESFESVLAFLADTFIEK